MLSFIKNILKFASHHSLGELFRRFWHILVKLLYEYDGEHIFQLDTASAANTDPTLDMKELTIDDINKMLEVMYVSRVGLEERIGRGDRCFAVLENNKIIGFSWAQFAKKEFNGLNLTFNLHDNQAWIYNSVTVKTARGRGLYGKVLNYIAKPLSQSGVDVVFGDSKPWNTPSLKGLKRAGFKRVALVERKKILFKISYKLTVFDSNAWSKLSHNNQQIRHLKK